MASVVNFTWVAAFAASGGAACGSQQSQSPEAAAAAPSVESAPPTLNPMRPQLGGGPALGGATEPKAATPERLMVKAGETFEVVLDANASTGFAWRVVEPLDARLAFTEQVYAGAAPITPGGLPLVGAPGKATLRFKAVTVGEATLVLRYARPWEPPGAPGVEGFERTFTVVVQ
jgi:predicted secreted protein